MGAGTTTITASQEGDANYLAATPVDQALTVNKGNQVLTLAPLPTGSQPLNEVSGPVQLTASSTSGLPVTITLGAGSAATLNGSNQLENIQPTGTITINADQAGDDNYNPASISVTYDVGKQNQSILFASLSELTYSDGLTFDLAGSAMASSTLAVTYSVLSGPATLSGTVLTVTGSGTVWIKASQPGDGTWNAAPDVTRPLTIKKAGIVIGNFASLEKTYGDAAFTLAASSVSTGQFSYSSSNPLVATVSGNTVTITGAGTAELTAVQAEDANYAQSTATVSLKVLQADQAISFGTLTAKTYDDAPFELTATASSALTVSYTSSNAEVATVSGSTVTIVGSGTTTITAMQPGNTNYKAAEPVEQELVVGKKSQAITFDALASKTYGDAPFELTATASSGLAVTYSSSNTAVATVSGSTVTIVGAGTTTITASQPGNDNYLAATDAAQNLTVNKADQVITLSPLPIGSLALKDITFPVQVTASSSSGLPVTITLGSGSAATLNGSNQLENIQQSGTITIELNQAGDDNYNAATASYSFDVEKSNQHITFPAITGRVFSAGLTIDLSGSAYASSGLEVVYTLVSGPATLSGTVLNVTGSGMIVVTASQAGNSTWNQAPDVTQTISIGKAIPEIINFADLYKTYGDLPFSLNASSASTGMFTYSSSDETVATVEGSQVTVKGAGTAVLTATQASDANYAQATATASLLVEKADQTISFDALPVKTFGDGAFGLSALSTSGLAVSYISSDETVATVSGSTGTIVGAGTAVVTATQAGNSNYKPATAVTRLLTVNKESQSIAFAALDGKTYGDAPFTLSATGGGSGNAVSFTSSDNTVATVSGNTVTIMGAGTCTIYANQEGNTNYTAAPQVGQVLTVGKAGQSISFDALADKTYGDAAFDLSATTTSGLTISYVSSNTAVATVSGNTITITGAGTTSITAIPAGNANYNTALPVVQSLTVIKSAQTITFSALSDKVYGDADFDLTGTASSGLTVSYTSSNESVATVSGSTVTIVGAGTTIITASQAGNGNYNAAVSVSQSLTVSNQGQEIVFDALPEKVYGDAPFTVSATGGGSGNPVVFSSSDASVATVSGNTITITGAGSCTIYANQAGNEDYSSSSASQPLTVEKATQAISFGPLAGKTYGDADFTLSGTASSGLTVSYSSSNPEVATVSGNTITIKGVGSTTITASQPGNNNYNAATSVLQTLTVDKADQSISFASLADKTYGEAPFTLTATASSGLAVTYSSSNEAVATVSGNTITIVGAGSVTITATQAGDVNYNAASPVEQALTVGKGSQSISFASLADKTYGDAAFELTATASSGLTINYISSNEQVATVSGNTVTIVGAGTTTITASQEGDANYLAATPVDQALTVNKGNQVLTLAPLPTGSQPLNEVSGPVQLTASSTSGLPVTITLGAGSAATLNGSNQLENIQPTGTITINADQAGDDNYNPASISVTYDVGKQNQSILFASLSELTYSDGLTFDLAGSAMASSTLAVTYSVLSGPATLSGTVLTVTGSGTVWIKASQPGDGTWNAAPDVTRPLTIKKAGIVIGNFASLEKTYGDAAFTLAASSVSTGQFSYSSSNPLVATVSGNTVTITGAGTAELTAVQAEDANYAQSTATVSLKVLQADQAISFGTLTAKTYDDAPFELTATASSALTVSYTSSNAEVATVSGSTVTIVGSGTTTITAMQPGNTNYKAAEPVEQELVVGKKSQAITFDALASKTYGDAPFELTATASSGLAVTYSSSNTAVATVSGSTVTIVGAGTTTITASQPGNDNYLAATDAAQNLTVNKADQVITLSPLPIGSLALKDITFPVQVTASSSSGLPVTITLGSGSAATLNGSNQLENIQQSGTITIELNQAGDDNYNAATASYSFDVEKSNQHITFPAITGRVFSAGLTIDLSGSAYASSGLEVVYTLVSGPATLSGTVLNVTGSGMIVVTASQAGNSTWNQAPDVTQTISIGKAIPEIINFADLYKTYGDLPFSLNASSASTGMFTYSSSDETVATVEGSQVTVKGAGTAVLTATQASDANYAQATATASLLVEKADQTISFDALPVKTFGDGAFGLSALSTSGLAVSYISSDETVATVSGSTGTIVGAGTAVVTATQAGNSNYKPATAVTRLLTVNKESQSIAFAALDGKTYGDAPFTLSATGGGSGNAVSFTSSDNTVATVSGNTVTIMGAGTCTIYANQEGNTNYTAAPQVGQVLTVGKAGQSISFDALADKTYGDAAFDLSATTTSGLTISYVSSNTAVATVSGNTITITGAGTTSITAIPAGNANYNTALPVVQSLTVIKSAQTITFSALSDKVYGDADFDLTGTASSGLTVSYTSSNESVATVSGSTVTIVGAGTTIITASQAGNGNYNAAVSVSQSLTVSNQGQEIVFDALPEKVYGDAPFTVSATGGGSGNPVVFSSSDASVATVSGNTITITGAGSCTIYANQAGNEDYSSASASQPLTVEKATQAISFGPLAGKTYGDADFTLSGTASSGLTVSYSSSNPEVATVSGNTITIKGVGSTTITASQPGNNNYNAATTVEQMLTVVKADQAITFDALSGKTYGDAAFELTATASSGLVVAYSSSDESVATISGNTVTIVGAGTTTITATQSGNVNYNAATPVEQPLTVGQSGQTITFAALADKTYGDAAFTLTATASSGLAVTYSSSNTAVATVSGNTITIVGAGTTTITASQSGDANYLAATPVDQALTVNKGNQVLTLDPLPTGSQPLNEVSGPVQLTASSTSGLPVTITLGAGSAATLNGSNQLENIQPTGTITINADQAGDDNYNPASISVTYDVGKQNQSILFASLSELTYSDGLTFDLAGSAMASSTLAVTYSVLSGPATLSGTVLTVTGSGTVWIKASQPGDGTWNAAPDVTRPLTIKKAGIVIGNFASLEKTYGDAAFTLAASSVSTGQFSYSSSNPLVATVSGNTVTITGAGTAELTAVQAEDANYAQSTATVSLKVLQADQAISFGTLTAKTYDDAPFELTATASSALTVSYTSSNAEVATVSGSTVTIVGSGTTTITAMQPGNTNYKAAEPVEQELVVGKKSQAITFDALASKTYGDAPFELTATASSGLAVTYSSSNTAVATVSGSTVTIVGAGTTTITASQPGNDNYLAATDAAQNLTVNKADQVITLSPLPIGSLALKDITFPVQVTASSSSGLPVTITLGSGSAATLNGSNQLENIQQSGTITIELNQAGDDNYNAATASYSFDVEKSNQHITFPAITGRVFSAGLTIDLSGSAYASSGLEVVYTLVSGPATLSGTVLNVTGSGMIVVTASQAGNSTWNQAPDVTQTISIGKAIPEIINFADLYKTYGDLPFSLNASSASTGMFTYSSSDETVATVEGSQVTVKGAGTAVLTATQASDANYAQATATASLLVEKADQTISFDALPVKTFGDGAFGLSALSTSGLAVSYISSDETVATVSGSTGTIVGAGTAVVTATQAGNSNYKPATAVTRLLTVNKESQSIAFAALDGKTYGDAPFTLSATGGGSGNAVSFTSSDNTVATVSGNTVTIMGAGTCTIYANQEGNTNYTAAPQVGQVLTVGKAGQSISFDALADKTYGDAAFDLSATTTSGLTISYVSSNTAVATVSGNTITITGAGTTSITAIPAGNANYNTALPVVQSLTVIKSAQTITFSALSDKVYGDADFDLTGTASSGLTVSYTSSNESVATVSGSTVTIVGAGTTIITASQAGNGNYNAAVSVSQSLTVSNQGQEIVFDALPEKVYGDAPFTVSATGGGSGNPVVFSSSDASVATVSGNTITITGAGSCTIYANQAGNEDYSSSSASQPLTVEKATQAISFGPLAGKTYGDADFTLSGTASSGLTVSYSSSNPEVATVSGNTITIKGVGSTTITASQPGNNNYNAATSVLQTLTVDKADQSISFASLADKTYGEAPFTLTATASSGLAVTYSSSNEAVATVSGNTITIVGAGSVTITATQAGDVNYNAASPVEQALTVGKGSQSISFASPCR